MTKFLPLFLLLFMVSCGTKKTSISLKRQNNTSLYKFLDDKGLQYNKEDIAVLNDFPTFVEFDKLGKLATPEAYFFNKDGYRVKDNFKGAACGQVISNMDKVNNAPTDKKEHLKDWLKHINFISNPTEAESNLLNDSYDAFVIVTWAMYVDSVLSGELTNTSLGWYKSLYQNHDLKVKIIFLNLDVQENWPMSDEVRKALNLTE